MSELGQHIRIRLSDDRVIASTPGQRRTLARTILRLARQDNLLTFGLADTHLHMSAGCTQAAGGQLARRIELSLGYTFKYNIGFAPAYVQPIRDGRHLYNTFRYILNQNGRHALEWDPLCEASNLPDLLGLRMLGRYTAANVRRFLPRLKREDLLAWLGVRELEPADGPIELIVEASVAAAGLPELVGSSKDVIEARRAILHVVDRRLPLDELTTMLGVGRRTLFRLKVEPADRRLVQAIRLQLGLMAQRGDRTSIDGPFVAAAVEKGP